LLQVCVERFDFASLYAMMDFHRQPMVMARLKTRDFAIVRSSKILVSQRPGLGLRAEQSALP
jgi:hypothetical protein